MWMLPLYLHVNQKSDDDDDDDDDFTIYGHGGHLDEQILTICINFQSPLTEGST